MTRFSPNRANRAFFEPFVRSAVEYVRLAEAAAGPVPRHVADDDIWGAALQVLERFHPHARIVNLETAAMRSAQPDADKQIPYRMHPANIGCLRAALQRTGAQAMRRRRFAQ